MATLQVWCPGQPAVRGPSPRTQEAASSATALGGASGAGLRAGSTYPRVHLYGFAPSAGGGCWGKHKCGVCVCGGGVAGCLFNLVRGMEGAMMIVGHEGRAPPPRLHVTLPPPPLDHPVIPGGVVPLRLTTMHACMAPGQVRIYAPIAGWPHGRAVQCTCTRHRCTFSSWSGKTLSKCECACGGGLG